MSHPKLSIVIPCYNEIQTIGTIIKKVSEVDLPINREIIIVDDCSVDGTAQFLKKIAADNIKVFFHEQNQGKGAALRTGFMHSKGDIIIIQDADLEYAPEDYKKLLKPIMDGKADVVYGSRFISGDEHRVLYFWHSVGNKLLTLLSNIFTNLNLSDMEVCYKVFKKQLLNQFDLEENRFGFEPEFTAKIARLDIKIFEVGISYAGRTYEEGKKINWKDGIRAIFVILNYGLIFRK